MAKGRTYFPRLSEKELYRQESIAMIKAKRKFEEEKAKKAAEQAARDAVEKYAEMLTKKEETPS